MNESGNLYAGIPEEFRDEFFETVLSASHVSIARIVSKGHASPEGFWYDQDDNEWVILLKGKALLRFERPSRSMTLNPGDYVHIEKHVRHRVEWTDPKEDTIWLAVHYSGRIET